MRHLDLFTGICGFAYAAQQVWKDEYELVACCEINKFRQKIIRKYHPDVEIINDVRDERIKQFRDIDLLTAGVPCQPASVAGKKRGASDERWLWPETLDIIRAIRPRWALLENVPGLFSLENGEAFNGILSGLAESGYDCWWEVIPACAVGACHKRDRIWIVGYASNGGCSRFSRWRSGQKFENGCENVSFPQKQSERPGFCKIEQTEIGRGRFGNGDSERNAADTEKPGLERQKPAGLLRKQNRLLAECSRWAVEPDVGRVAYGIPNRVDRIAALGDSIVPAVAMVIMEAIKEIEASVNSVAKI